MKNLGCLLVFLVCCCSLGWSQTRNLKGTVRDAQTKEILPFVSILINQGPNGTASDISGKFEIKNSVPVTQLTLNYVGYEPQTVVLSPNQVEVAVLLQPKTSALREVVVLAGYNPAHRIIKLASQNRRRNDPGQLPAYHYRVYNKTYATFSPSEAAYNDSLRQAQRKKRQLAAPEKAPAAPGENPFTNSYFFLSESLADHAFLKPDLNQETVLATRISGWDNPKLAILANDAQDFSIYKDLVKFFEKSYVSPLSEGSTNKYDFQLQDTTFVGTDSIFIISYKPRSNHNFEGLQGQLHVSSRNWAAVNVLAETAGNQKPKNRLQQQYAQIGQKWFPVEANAEMMIPMLNGQFISLFSRSSFTNYDLNPALRRRDFKGITVKINDDAGTKNEAFWAQHRPDSLSTKELRTYVVVDSINTAEGIDQGKIIEVLFTKQLSLGAISLDIDRIIKVNRYEDTRLGMGAHTNSNISQFISVGGFVGYGIKDKGWKYGGDLSFNLHRESDLKLTLAYAEDLLESGGLHLPFQPNDLLSSNYRQLAVKNMDKVTHRSAFFTVRTLKYLNLQTGFQHEYKRTTSGYAFQISPDQETSNFRFSEAVIGFRYAFREQVMRLYRTNYSLGSRYPIIWFQYRQGFNEPMQGEFSYRRYTFRVSKTLQTKMLGSTSIMLDGGLVQGKVPYPNLFNGNAANYYLYSSEGFQTMGMNEFLMDQYAALYLNHNLGKLLYQSKKFSPSLAIATNIGFGSLRNPEAHKNIAFKTMENGFFESGLLVNNLFTYRNFYSVGAGAFYRYGAYQLPKLKDNLAFRITTSINL